MGWQLELNGHSVEEVLAVTRAFAAIFNWKVENPEPYEAESSFAQSPSVVVAAYNIQHSEGFHRVVVSLQGDGEDRRCHLTRQARQELDSSFVDEEWKTHYDALGNALAAATL